MMIETSGQISAVRRSLGARVLEAGEARVLTISQTYAAEMTEVWRACTDRERIARWFLPVTGDLQLGGRYQLEGNAAGTVEACEPPRRLALTWEFGGSLSWVEVTLTEADEGRTRFTLEHIAHVDDHWDEYGPGAVGIGWDLGVLGLAQHLAGAPAVDPAEAGAWMASPDGRGFMTESGERWYQADVTAGADPTAARARADRTIGFYTGADGSPAPG